MRMSARNRLKGRIRSIEPGPIRSKVKIDTGGGNQVTSVISTEAVDDLELAAGSACVGVIKASSVMVGVDH